MRGTSGDNIQRNRDEILDGIESKIENVPIPTVCVPAVAELNEFRHGVNMITGRWKIDILWMLLARPLRFGELRRALPGITQHTLTAQLRALEADGLVSRTAYAVIPPRVDYALTEDARALKPIFEGLAVWARSLRKSEDSRP